MDGFISLSDTDFEALQEPRQEATRLLGCSRKLRPASAFVVETLERLFVLIRHGVCPEATAPVVIVASSDAPFFEHPILPSLSRSPVIGSNRHSITVSLSIRSSS